jgi:hypothetical protein
MAETKTPAQIKAEEDARNKHAEQNKPQAAPRAGSGMVTPGAMTTYKSKAATVDPEDIPEMTFTFDEVKGLVGDIQRGELAHIKLTPEGEPTGAAFRDIPKADDITAPVYGSPTVQFDELVTPSGAPITKHMNPEQAIWDAGMLARNPIPEPDERQKKYRLIGGGVVNQPVTV